MEFRKLGASGLQVPVLTLGTATFGGAPRFQSWGTTDGAEATQVSRVVTQLAMAYPEVGFTLTSAARTVLQCPPAGSLGDRLFQIYGERTDLIEVWKDAGGLRVTGFVAALADHFCRKTDRKTGRATGRTHRRSRAADLTHSASARC